jgi:lipopolysaccharide transport system ATP-binding protein
MSDISVQVEHLGKEFRIGGPKERYLTFRDSLAAAVRSPFRRRQTPSSRMWALKDVSFEIKQGEAVGIIGRNGAGKSTLLKILSRITEPTEGRVTLRGRVASLLEVGTGFHPELTGRENIYLNGAILGLTRAEIKSKFDEIVDFAEVERFLETPVKRYSSGMYVRLAFAVAAHLEAENLLLDEVLAVGDAQFQKKCLGRINHVARSGRTVFLVSHNMGAIKQFCTKAILLESGKTFCEGDAHEVVDTYVRMDTADSGCEYEWDDSSAPGDDAVRLTSMRVCSDQGNARNEFGTDEPIHVQIEYRVLKRLPFFRVGFSLNSTDGTYVFFSSDDDMDEYAGRERGPGNYVSKCRIPDNLLNIGSYYLVVSGDIFGDRVVLGGLPRLRFSVLSTGGPTSRFSEPKRGVICPSLTWEMVCNDV